MRRKREAEMGKYNLCVNKREARREKLFFFVILFFKNFVLACARAFFFSLAAPPLPTQTSVIFFSTAKKKNDMSENGEKATKCSGSKLRVSQHQSRIISSQEP